MPDMFREIREPGTGRLIARFDPERDLLEIKQHRVVTLIDLTQFRDTKSLDNGRDSVKISTY